MYVKIFRKILTSSIWEESDTTRLVWIAMLAWMDEDGFCQASSPEALARLARVTPKAAIKAVEVLESPDLKSPGQDDDGRRIERVPGGWMVLNAGKYREISKREIQKAQNRAYVAKFREKKRRNRNKYRSTYTYRG